MTSDRRELPLGSATGDTNAAAPAAPAGHGGAPAESERDAATRLLDAAEAVFAEVGFAGATTATIAERAGVTKALVHYYYRSKESLYRAVMVRSEASLAELILADLEHDAPLVAITSALRRYCRFLADHPRYVRLCLYNALEGSHRLSDTPKFRQLVDVTTRALTRGVASGEFRPLDPQLMIVTIDSLCGHFFEHEAAFNEIWTEPKDREDRVASYIDHVVEVIKTALLPPSKG